MHQPHPRELESGIIRFSSSTTNGWTSHEHELRHDAEPDDASELPLKLQLHAATSSGIRTMPNTFLTFRPIG